MDSGFSDQRLGTPPSSVAGTYTPGSSTSSQGGGGTPYNSRSGTPFTQDSGFSGGRLVADSYYTLNDTPNFTFGSVTLGLWFNILSSSSLCS